MPPRLTVAQKAAKEAAAAVAAATVAATADAHKLVELVAAIQAGSADPSDVNRFSELYLPERKSAATTLNPVAARKVSSSAAFLKIIINEARRTFTTLAAATTKRASHDPFSPADHGTATMEEEDVTVAPLSAKTNDLKVWEVSATLVARNLDSYIPNLDLINLVPMEAMHLLCNHVLFISYNRSYSLYAVTQTTRAFITVESLVSEETATPGLQKSYRLMPTTLVYACSSASLETYRRKDNDIDLSTAIGASAPGMTSTVSGKRALDLGDISDTRPGKTPRPHDSGAAALAEALSERSRERGTQALARGSRRSPQLLWHQKADSHSEQKV